MPFKQTKRPMGLSGLAGALLALLTVTIAMLVAPTAAHAASEGSIAVYDSADQTLRIYNSATASTYVATNTQTIYTGFDDSPDPAPWSEIRGSVRTVEVADYGIQPSHTQHWFDGFTSLVSADIAKLDMTEIEDTGEPMFAGDANLERLTVSATNNVSTSPDAIPEHAIRGRYGEKWTLEGGDGTQYTPTQLRDLINGGQAVGTWVWATMAEDEARRYPRVEERIDDPIDSTYRTASDGHNGQDLTHRIAATFPSSIGNRSSYTTYQAVIEAHLDGLALSSIDDIAIDISGADITEEIKSGAYGSIAYQEGTLTVTINDALSGFGKGVEVNRQSILSVYYKAHTTDSSGVVGKTSSKMTYSSPADKTTAMAETTEATTLTASYALSITKVDRTERTAIQGATLTVYSQSNGKFVQADGSLADAACELTTGEDGSVVIPHVGRGTYTISDVGTGTATTVHITPSYSLIPAGIEGLSATATGDNIAQPGDGQQVVGDGQDGIVLVDAGTGTVSVRISEQPPVQSPIMATRPQVQSATSSVSSPTSYTIELLKVDKATKTPIALAGYKVATRQGGTTYYVQEDGSLTTSPSEAHVFTTDDNGKVEIRGLSATSYVFHEATHPNHYSLDAPDFTVAISATRDSQTDELTALNATYAGGFEDIRHKGAGYAVGHEDGILSASVETGKIEVRSSIEYVLDMPRAGIDGDASHGILITLLSNYLLSVALFAARQGVLKDRPFARAD